MSHLFSKENIDFTHEPLFLGSGRNVARLDLNIEQHIQKQVDDALGLMWFATDFTFGGDAKDYFKMDEKLSRLYLKNLKLVFVVIYIINRYQGFSNARFRY